MHSENEDQYFNARSDNFATSNESRSLNLNLEDLSKYTLTIGEASSLMHTERCKFASSRKVQRMCKEGKIDCWKLSTTRNGQPVAEWLVNEASLRKHIDICEIKWDDNVAISSHKTHWDHGNANASPHGFGNARRNRIDDKEPALAPNALVSPNLNGNANGVARNQKFQANISEDMATPVEDGETRSLASLLIENARLTSELEGKRELEAEMRDEKLFLREELKEARAGRKDVAAIAERMLETLESIAIGGKLMSGSHPSQRNHQASQSNPRAQYQSIPDPVSGRVDYRKSETVDDITDVEVTDMLKSTKPNQSFQSDPPEPENPFRI